MTMLNELIRYAGERGLAKAPGRPNTEDVIRGYFDTDDVGYGLRMLISSFEVQKQAQKFRVGDRVRMKRRFWYLGDSNDGWSGFSQMFADAHGTVTEVAWSVRDECWFLVVKYADPYRYSDYTRDFNVNTDSSSFMFHLDYVKKVK